MKDEEEFPRVVMAPNAAEHFENLQLERALVESQKLNEATKRRQILVVKSHSADRKEFFNSIINEVSTKSSIECLSASFYTPRIRNSEIYGCRNNNNQRCPSES